MTESEILKATRHYARTGRILDGLKPYFDQHGRWVGSAWNWKRRTVEVAAGRMIHASLPAARRTCRKREGTRLLTSLIIREKSPVLIPWCEVAGSIRVAEAASVSAPNLRIVNGGFFTFCRSHVRLPNLREVGGGFSTMFTCKLQAPRLKKVGGNLDVYDFKFPLLETVGKRLFMKWTLQANAPKLRSVGGTLDAHIAAAFDAPLLQTVGGHFKMNILTKRVSVPSLESVGGRFLASGAEVIDARRLKRVGSSINTASAAKFYQPIHCGGEWTMHPAAKRRWILNQAARDALRQSPVIDI